MKNLLFSIALSLTAVVQCHGEEDTTTVPVHRLDNERWRNRHEECKEAAKRGANLVFIGDSITSGWDRAGKEQWEKHFAPHGALNFGSGGDRTQHILWRLQNGELPDELDPKVMVLLIGTNNIGHSQAAVENTAEGIRHIIDYLRDKRPKMKILLLGIFPRGETPENPSRVRNEKINAIIKDFGDGEHVHYLDIGPVFLDENGILSKNIMPDLLHLSETGYQLWAEAIAGKVRELGGFPETH